MLLPEFIVFVKVLFVAFLITSINDFAAILRLSKAGPCILPDLSSIRIISDVFEIILGEAEDLLKLLIFHHIKFQIY